MIGSFSDRRTENVFNGISEKSFPASILRRARSKISANPAYEPCDCLAGEAHIAGTVIWTLRRV